MTDDESTGLDIPRRKLLGAIGTVGIASGGAGLGTSAYFNDTESFEGNSLQAGTLNLQIGGSVAAMNSEAIAIEIESAPVSDRSTATAFFGLSDIKPGDLAIVCLELLIDGNPAHLMLNGSVVSAENSVNEAEAGATGEDDTLGSTGGTGELASNTNIQAFGPIQQPSGGFSSVDLENYSSSLESFSASGGNGTFAGGGEVSIAGAFGSGTDYLLTNTNENCFDPDTYRLYFALNVPSDVGNVIQSDSLDLDLTVEAVQCRHNDDTPFSDSGN